MIHPRKPVWTEGLFMTPQHLQQSDQYHEALLHSRMHAVMSYDWGITGVSFDDRALVAGQLKLLKCHGFFPDGTPFFVGDRGEDSVEARPLGSGTSATPLPANPSPTAPSASAGSVVTEPKAVRVHSIDAQPRRRAIGIGIACHGR